VLFTVYVEEGDRGPLHTVQLGAAEVLRPVRSLLGFAASPLSEARDRVGGTLSREDEERLVEEVRRYREGAADAARLRRENGRLRELLNGAQAGYEYAPLARVVAPVGGAFTDRVTINVGSDDGVRPEQPVVVGESTLVGRTTSAVTPGTAEVMLVTDPDFAAGARVVPPGGEASSDDVTGVGLLRTSWDGYLGLEYVDLEARAEQGDLVVTSGREVGSGRRLLFPPGLLIGTVETASSSDVEPYKKIVVQPAVRSDELEEVRVITRW
jgi:rod shape-determining protein MreC